MSASEGEPCSRPKAARRGGHGSSTRLKPGHAVVLADPIHLRYFANFHVEAISQPRTSAGCW